MDLYSIYCMCADIRLSADAVTLNTVAERSYFKCKVHAQTEILTVQDEWSEAH